MPFVILVARNSKKFLFTYDFCISGLYKIFLSFHDYADMKNSIQFVPIQI